MPKSTLFVAFLAGALASTLGCGGGGTGGTPSTTGTLSVRVMLGRQADARSPAAGATVALQRADGTRVEHVSAADGRALFDVDFQPGPVAVTAYLDGHPLRSRVGVDSAKDEVVLALDQPQGITPVVTGPTVAISGKATGMSTEKASLLVTASVTAGYNDNVGPDWSMRVPANQPFTLTALEYANGPDLISDRGWTRAVHAWTTVTHDAMAQDGTIALDMGAKLTPKVVSGTVEYKGLRVGSELATIAWPWAWVYQRGVDWPSSWVGFLDYADFNPYAREFKYRIEHIEPSFVTQPVTGWQLGYQTGSVYDASAVQVDGYPAGGAQALTFLDLPDVAVPAVRTDSSLLHDPMRFYINDTDVDVALVFPVTVDPRQAVWVVEVPTGATALTVPAAPSPFDEAARLPYGIFEGQLVVYRSDALGIRQHAWVGMELQLK